MNKLQAVAAGDNTKELKDLRAAIHDMDALAQCVFSEIAGIARLALAALETPHGRDDMESLAAALGAICGRADDAENGINWRAEQVGCNYRDQAPARRFAARVQAEAMQRPARGS